MSSTVSRAPPPVADEPKPSHVTFDQSPTTSTSLQAEDQPSEHNGETLTSPVKLECDTTSSTIPPLSPDNRGCKRKDGPCSDGSETCGKRMRHFGPVCQPNEAPQSAYARERVKTEKEIQVKVGRLARIIERYISKPLSEDQFEAKGKSKLEAGLYRFVKNNRPIMMVMVGMPLKSGSALSCYADAGDYALLKSISSLVVECRLAYRPGCVFKIVSDGFVINDIRGISDHAVCTYIRSLTDMLKGMKMSDHVHIVTLADFAGSECEKQNIPKIRKEFFKQLGSDSKVREAVATMPPDNSAQSRARMTTTQLAFKGFLVEETLHLQEMNDLCPPMHTPLSPTELTAKAISLAQTRLHRHLAFNTLCRNNIQREHLRFSLFPQLNDGPKYAFKGTGLPDSISPDEFQARTGFSYDPYRPATPWNSVPVVWPNNECMVLPRSRVVRMKNVVLEYRDGRPYCYRLLCPAAWTIMSGKVPEERFEAWNAEWEEEAQVIREEQSRAQMLQWAEEAKREAELENRILQGGDD